MKNNAIIAMIVAMMLFSNPVPAQETSGEFAGGSILIGSDNRACSGALEGSIRYNTTSNIHEYCSSSCWIQFGLYSCTPPTVNNVQTSSTSSNPDTNHTLSNYAVPVVTSGMLIVTVASEDNNSSSDSLPSSVTFNGTGMTLAASVIDGYTPNDKAASLYYMANPPQVTADIVVTMPGNVEAIQVGAYTVSCLLAQAPEATATQGPATTKTSLDTNITTVTAGAFIAEILENGDDAAGSLAVSQGPDQIELYVSNTPSSASSSHAGSYRLGGAAGPYTMGWTWSPSNSVAHVVAAFETGGC